MPIGPGVLCELIAVGAVGMDHSEITPGKLFGKGAFDLNSDERCGRRIKIGDIDLRALGLDSKLLHQLVVLRPAAGDIDEDVLSTEKQHGTQNCQTCNEQQEQERAQNGGAASAEETAEN